MIVPAQQVGKDPILILESSVPPDGRISDGRQGSVEVGGEAALGYERREI